MNASNRRCRSHIVSIVKMDESQIPNMEQEWDQTDKSPDQLRASVDHTSDADDGVKESVHDGGSRGKVIEFLRARPVATVVDGRPEPGVDADDSVSEIEGTHVVVFGDGAFETGPGENVHVSIEEGEEDRGGFLHAEEAVERPFAVVLVDRLVLLDGIFGDGVHAEVSTVVDARPLCQSQR